jgi:hypothetical protein
MMKVSSRSTRIPEKLRIKSFISKVLKEKYGAIQALQKVINDSFWRRLTKKERKLPKEKLKK